MTKKLNTDEMLEKLNKLTLLAKSKEKSSNIIEQIGVITVYAAAVDFVFIQAARLIEQIILKSHIAEDKEIKFQPHEDDWFYDQQIRSRKIISEIKKLLPFKAVNQNEINDAKKVSDLGVKFLTDGDKFLNSRNKTIHHIFSPNLDVEKIQMEIEKTISKYHQFMDSQKEFFEALQPYRFSEKEIRYFYGKPSNKS